MKTDGLKIFELHHFLGLRVIKDDFSKDITSVHYFLRDDIINVGFNRLSNGRFLFNLTPLIRIELFNSLIPAASFIHIAQQLVMNSIHYSFGHEIVAKDLLMKFVDADSEELPVARGAFEVYL